MESGVPVAAHRPVLLDEVLDGWLTDPCGCYVDGTFGRGGHSRALLAGLAPTGRLLGLDRDPEALAEGRALQQQEQRFSFVQSRFAAMPGVLQTLGLKGQVQGILLDLGVSSPQLDRAERGFSFLREGPLDMRMDPQSGISAADWVANTRSEEMAEVFKRYGEERYARRIARAIVDAREQQAITGTRQLADIIAAAHPHWPRHIHPATRCFQAIRIVVNEELDELAALLAQVRELLAIGGRLLVISFHSLEDRMVKQFMRRESRGRELPPEIPVMAEQQQPNMKLIGKPRRASDAECRANPRARSAILRIAERLT